MTYTHYLKALRKKSASMILLMKIDPWYYNMDDGSSSEINDHSYNYDGVDDFKCPNMAMAYDDFMAYQSGNVNAKKKHHSWLCFIADQ